MKLCKAKLPDGKPCPHNVDEGQEYCPHHLASRVTRFAKVRNMVASLFGVVLIIYKVVKFVISKRL